MKLSDYVMQHLADAGVRDVFMVSGGGIMHLVDSLGRAGGLRYWCNYHEQACAIAAEGYARVAGGVGVCLVTTGPGALNALSGIAGAWYDSIPVLVISGQVRRDLIADYDKVRQWGPQEGNVVPMARAVTKYAVTVREPLEIRRELGKALAIARQGRPGPVWVEIPLDVQGAEIDTERLAPVELALPDPALGAAALDAGVREVMAALRAARRPLFIGGNGIHLAGAERIFLELLDRLPVPVVLPDIAKDLVPEDHPRYVGIFGTAGQRRANFAVQNSDCVVSLAAGLCCKKIGFNYRGFAPKARKIVVDIDRGQLEHQIFKPDLALRAEIGAFIRGLLEAAAGGGIAPDPRWLAACAEWKRRYPILLEEHLRDREHVNSYFFMDRLADQLTGEDQIVTGNGLDCVSFWQGFRVKAGQRALLNGNWGAMGWDLPAAVGACVGGGARRTICVTGDGSIELNVQELLTIKRHRLPVKIFLFNNKGYTSVRMTQDAFFEGRHVGSDFGSGLDNPDFAHLAAAYGLAYLQARTNDEVEAAIREALALPGAALCEINISPGQGYAPKASAFRREDGTLESRPLEDMAPFLPREELQGNMRLFDGEAAP